MLCIWCHIIDDYVLQAACRSASVIESRLEPVSEPQIITCHRRTVHSICSNMAIINHRIVDLEELNKGNSKELAAICKPCLSETTSHSCPTYWLPSFPIIALDILFPKPQDCQLWCVIVHSHIFQSISQPMNSQDCFYPVVKKNFFRDTTSAFFSSHFQNCSSKNLPLTAYSLCSTSHRQY